MHAGTPIAVIRRTPSDWTDRQAVVQGWVRTRRDSKAGVSFVNLSDGSCFDPLQLVVPNSLANYQSEVMKLTAGCSIEAEGRLVEVQGKPGQLEMQVERLRVYGFVEDPDTYPIQPKAHTMEFLREQAHLRARTNTFGALGRLRHTMAQAVHRWFSEHGFFWIHTPIVTASDCEGAGEMFRVSTLDLANLPRTPDGTVDFSQDFFGKEAHLTVSGQLNVECWCLALSKVYTFGPTFRAENSNTSRHLAEFWMIEPEIAFADLKMDADCAEGLLKAIFRACLEERADDMKFFVERVDKDAIARLEKFCSASFERIDYTEAIRLLEKAAAGGHRFEFAPHWGIDMQSEHERYLTEQVFGRPVVVMNYPKDIKA
ncbi:MAG: asparagine--tRNA ligase, partial [Phycisphaerales bacterium]